MGYRAATIRGISWMGFLRFIVKSVGFFEMLILARILEPSQFGAYGVALLILGLLEVITESGVNIVLVQEKEIDKFINSAWIVSIGRGVLIAIVILISAPFISNFFHSQESLNLLYLISIVPLLRGFLNPSIVKFQKDLLFRKDFLFQLPMVIVDTVISITVCYLLRSPIGIVLGLIAGVIVQLVMSFFVASPRPKWRLEKEYLHKVFHRGKWVTASVISNYLFQNVDNIIVGRVLGPSSLGIYQVAYSLAILPVTEISDVFSRVTFPIYTKISEDKKRLFSAFVKVIVVISAITIPYGLILGFFPNVIVPTVLGDKWVGAISILPVLALFGAIKGISGSTSAIFLAINKQEYVTVITFVSILGLIIPIIPLVYSYGMIGAAYSALFGSIVVLPVIGLYMYRIFKKGNKI